MSDKKKDPMKVQLKDVRLSYPALFRPKAYADGEGEPAYSANFLIPKDTKLGKSLIDMIYDVIDEAKEVKWADKQPKLKSDKIFFKDGDDMEDPSPENEGMMIVTARNYKQPKILDRDKTELVEADGIPYAGCYVDAIIRIWVQDNKYGKRVNCELQAVRFRRDGEAFGAAPFDPDEFDELEEDDKSSRSSRRSSRDKDEEKDDDYRSSRRSSRDKDEEKDDDRSSRRSSRDKDEEKDDDRSSRRSSRDKDDDEDRPSRRSRDEDDDRSSRRSSRRNDDV